MELVDICVILRLVIPVVYDLISVLRPWSPTHSNTQVLVTIQTFLAANHVTNSKNMVSHRVDIPLHGACTVEHKGEVTDCQLKVATTIWPPVYSHAFACAFTFDVADIVVRDRFWACGRLWRRTWRERVVIVHISVRGGVVVHVVVHGARCSSVRSKNSEVMRCGR